MEQPATPGTVSSPYAAVPPSNDELSFYRQQQHLNAAVARAATSPTARREAKKAEKEYLKQLRARGLTIFEGEVLPYKEVWARCGRKGAAHGWKGAAHGWKGAVHGRKGASHGWKGALHGVKGAEHGEKGASHGWKGASQSESARGAFESTNSTEMVDQKPEGIEKNSTGAHNPAMLTDTTSPQ